MEQQNSTTSSAAGEIADTWSFGNWEVGVAVLVLCIVLLGLLYLVLRWRKTGQQRYSMLSRHDAEFDEELQDAEAIDFDAEVPSNFENVKLRRFRPDASNGTSSHHTDAEDDEDDDSNPDAILAWAEKNIPSVAARSKR